MNITIIKKNVKHINIKVKPTLEVIVTVPRYTSQKYIDSILQKKQMWIEKKLEHFKNNYHPSIVKEYVNGESFEYLGKSYRLKVIHGDKNEVSLDKESLNLTVSDLLDFDKKEGLVKKWYENKAREIFLELIKRYNSIVQKDIKRVSIKTMKTRWGSCNHEKGYINLNLRLIEKPLYFIEYVVFHELVHLIYPNHSKDFYNYIAAYMPDWKERKKNL